MSCININRVILGGIVAGIVADALDFIADFVVLGPHWARNMKALGKPPDFTIHQIAAFEIIGLACGIFVIWLYAAMRPRYGPGPKTAIYAGVAAWVIGALLPNVAFMGIAGLFSFNLMAATTAANLVEFVVGALAGAALYKEGASTETAAAAHA